MTAFGITWGADEKKPEASREGPQLTFKALTGEDTGLKAVMEAWKTAELKRQGGRAGWVPWGLVAFDYDNDGCLDLCPAHHAEAGCLIIRSLFQEKGQVAFANVTAELGVDQATLPGGFTPIIWDVDGDGWLDFVGRGAGRGPTCFVNRAGKKFAAMPGFSLGQVMSVEVVGGESFPLGYVGYTGDPAVQLVYQPDTQTVKKVFTRLPLDDKPPEPVAELIEKGRKSGGGFRVNYHEGADLNGDGVADLAVAGWHPYGGMAFGRYLLADKQGQWLDRTKDLGLPEEGVPLLVTDLNADGFPDILIVRNAQAGGIYLNNGQGKFTRREGDVTRFVCSEITYGLATAYAVALSNRPNPDLVINNRRFGITEIYQNLGNGHFQRVVRASSCWADPVAIGDFNNDGLLDVALGGPGDSITIYLNQTRNPGNYCNLQPRMAQPNPYAVGAQVEVFRAGELGKVGAKPIWLEKAHADATPVHVGLGAAAMFDVRVTFPGKQLRVVEHKGLAAKPRLSVWPDGKLE